MSIEENKRKILSYLYETAAEGGFRGERIARDLGLEPGEINDAVELLHQDGLVEWFLSMGTAPFRFYSVEITPKGKYEIERRERLVTIMADVVVAPETPTEIDTPVLTSGQVIAILQDLLRIRPPVGSPYGFTPRDWEYCAAKKSDKTTLNVVLGSKFESAFYTLINLRNNVELMFRRSLDRYNREKGTAITPHFVPLHGGYGEHLFNEIARDIISSDVGVFETSDQAANVYLEIGVALTYGVRVLLLKNEIATNPASDVSGQTYVNYRNDAGEILDRDHEERLFRMVERAIENK